MCYQFLVLISLHLALTCKSPQLHGWCAALCEGGRVPDEEGASLPGPGTRQPQATIPCNPWRVSESGGRGDMQSKESFFIKGKGS